MTTHAAAAKMKRLRGAILDLVRDNHDQQRSRFDATALWSALVRGLSFDCSRNELKTAIQDLCGRGYCTCKESKNLDTGVVYISLIEITPRGRDLLEGTLEDPAVEL